VILILILILTLSSKNGEKYKKRENYVAIKNSAKTFDSLAATTTTGAEHRTLAHHVCNNKIALCSTAANGKGVGKWSGKWKWAEDPADHNAAQRHCHGQVHCGKCDEM